MILSKKRPPYRLYVLIVFLCSIAMISYTFPEELDITDYYEAARSEAATSISLGNYILFVILQYVDFIYHTLLFVSVRVGIPLNLITIIFLSLYYIIIVEVVRKDFSYVSIKNEVFIFSLLSCSFIWVQEISRTLAAIVFLYASIYQFKEGKKYVALLFLVASFFTHVFAAFFAFCLLLGNLFKKINFNKFFQYSILIGVVFIALITPDQIIGYAMEKIGGVESHYSGYSRIEIHGLFYYASMGYGDRISAIMSYCASLIIVLLSKKKTLMYWILYALCVVNTFFIFTNYSVFQRICMFAPLFIAYNAIDLVTDNNIRNKKIIYYMSLIGILVFIIEMYSYRNIYNIL